MGYKIIENCEVLICDNCGDKVVLFENDIPPVECEKCRVDRDPWLYNNAIVELIYHNGDRKTIRYTGQKIRTKYCVRATPWEFLDPVICVIDINKAGVVEYIIDGRFQSFTWKLCPSELLGKEDLSRPDWVKYLKRDL